MPLGVVQRLEQSRVWNNQVDSGGGRDPELLTSMPRDVVSAISAEPPAARDALDDLAKLKSQLSLDVEHYFEAYEVGQQRYVPR